MHNIDMVLAVAPRTISELGYTPAGPALLKAVLNKFGYTSKILDFNNDVENLTNLSSAEKNSVDNFFLYHNMYDSHIWQIIDNLYDTWAKQIIELNPRWVGISVFTQDCQRATRLLAIKIKSVSPNIKVLIGGAGIGNGFADELLTNQIIDAYIVGEGENAIIELLKGNYDYPGINKHNPIQVDDLDKIPFPDYTDYELASKSYNKYKSISKEDPAVALPVTGSRGCVKKCTFCDVSMHWPKFRWRSGKNIADEIKFQLDKHDIKFFRFTDSLVNGNMKEFRIMINELAKLRADLPEHEKFYWDAHYIVRGKRSMPAADFDVMRESGAGVMRWGVESGSPKVRDDMKKGFTQEDLDYSLEQFSRAGLKCKFLMIVGYPTETNNDFQMTLDMFDRYQHYSTLGTIHDVVLGPTMVLIPGTPVDINKDKNQIVKYGNHIHEWISLTNPTLTYNERLRRRILLQSHVENLGYEVGRSDDYAKKLYQDYLEIKNQKPIAPVIINNNFKYDFEVGGLVEY